MRNDIINSCSFNEEILAYVYDELSANGRERFESHLENCFLCIDELGEISQARYSVYEWKNVEFSPLETPRILLPAKSEAIKVSWLDSIGGAFAWNKSWAFAGGFAALLVVAAVGFALLRSADSPTVMTANPRSEPITQVQIQQQLERAHENTPGLDDFSPKLATMPLARPKQPPARKTTFASAKTRPNLERSAAAAVVKSGKTADQRLQESPTLGYYSEDRDESLRLADLFDDLEDRELD